MQMRIPAPAFAEEAGKQGKELIRQQAVKRECPFKLAKILFLCILLGAGILFGVVFSLHVSRYFSQTQSMFSSNPISWCDHSSKHFEGNRGLRLPDWLAGPSLAHNMSDAELLWAASMVPRRRGAPLKRVPKIAFMFLTRGPLPLAPLWERFFKGNQDFYSVYVHSSPDYTLEVPSSSVFYGRQIPSQEAQWGEITMCDAERRLLANALLDFSNERFILLSETCIPLYAFSTVYHHLILSRHSFVAAYNESGPYGTGRYNYQMAPVVNVEQWRKGSQWFEVNRKLGIHIVADTLYYQKFKQFCKPGCYVDEHYLPTMLSIEFSSQIANRSLTWVDWSRGGSHPAMFGKDDISEEFIRGIRGAGNCSYNGHLGPSCFLFARKFSPNTLDPLLQIGPKVIGL